MRAALGLALTLAFLTPAAAQEAPRPGVTETYPRKAPPPDGAGVKELESDRPIKRDETSYERSQRESGVFDRQGRVRSQSDQLSRQPAISTDRLRRGQNPSYGVGPGVNIIRRP